MFKNLHFNYYQNIVLSMFGATVNLIRPGVFMLILFTSCSVSKQVNKQAQKDILNSTALSPAHIGISIFEPSTGKYWYNYQAEKYYIPASNTKLFSLYAGMKYLGDSLPAAGYAINNDTLYILPTGDPTFLHPDFKVQKLFNFLKSAQKPVSIINTNWRETAWGIGWAWDDYNDDYMAERSFLPVYGNIIKWVYQSKNLNGKKANNFFSEPAVHWRYNLNADTAQDAFFIKRDLNSNVFNVSFGEGVSGEQQVPFVTNGLQSAITLLKDTLKLEVTEVSSKINKQFLTIYSRASDSLYKIMMYKSDNFFAEQTLLMASDKKLGFMNDEKIIDTILNTELKYIPQKPVWVDGSGLSRYNLFSPRDFIYILNKLKNDFGFNRLKSILPTGGIGTLKSYYLNDSGFIYAKTGSLSNVTALSGYLITRKNKLLIFSILANDFVSTPAILRRGFEKFLTGIRQRY